MDRYKFRGKRLDNGEWVEGSLINNLFFDSKTKRPITYIVHTSEHQEYDSFDDIEVLAAEVDPATVGQYTGKTLHDETELYRGDIIEYVTFNHDGTDNGIQKGYIEWADDAAAYVVYPHIGADEGDWLYLVLANDDEVRKLGTIHDNPELLGGRADATKI